MTTDTTDTTETTTFVERLKRFFRSDDRGPRDDRGGGRGEPTRRDAGGGWLSVESPTKEALYDVVGTAEGPYAVGDGGRVLRRTADGWRTALDSGPTTEGNALTCVDATDGGERVWFAGGNGALGAYDVATGRKYDYTAPKEKTSPWTALAVDGRRDDERVWIGNGSGELLALDVAGGRPTPGEVCEPGSGSTVAALAADGRPYAVETGGGVFRGEARSASDSRDASRPDDGERGDGDGGDWTAIGVEDPGGNVHDVAVGDGAATVAGDGGRLFRYDAATDNWTPIDAGSSVERRASGGQNPRGSDDAALYGIDRRDDRLVAVGVDGAAAERADGEGWTTRRTPTAADLHAVALGRPDVAVGVDGTIIERDR